MPDTNLELLIRRSELGSLRERDIDLLLCMELHAKTELTAFFGGLLGLRTENFTSAWISVSEAAGENDLVISFQTQNGLRLLLLENKIAASFTQDQPERYALRARAWRNKTGVDSVNTIIAAPADYLKACNSSIFDFQVSYEELCQVLAAAQDKRSAFLADRLRDGIRKKQNGWQSVPHDGATRTWALIHQMCQEHTPLLRMPPPAPVPGGSDWVYFKDAEGMERYRKEIYIVFKAGHGFADLQFCSTMAVALSAAVAGHLEPGMNVVQTGKSAAIRIAAAKLDFQSGDNDPQDVQTGLLACERLRGFFIAHEERLTNLG
ncbi:hypothetical protein [Hoeflea sp.]|uniref:hypothetical protein n=1 Tax=Hoeflea sp. TaxID=1940281 RepID=UPI003B01D81B